MLDDRIYLLTVNHRLRIMMIAVEMFHNLLFPKNYHDDNYMNMNDSLHSYYNLKNKRICFFFIIIFR